MAVACICGRVPRPGDVQCSLCGRELAVEQPAVSGSPSPPAPFAPHPAASPVQPSRSPLAVLLLVLLVVVLAAAALLVLRARDRAAAGPEIGSPTSDARGADAPTSAAGPASEEAATPFVDPVTPTDEPTEPPIDTSSPQDPPERFPKTLRVVENAGGMPCSTLPLRSGYGEYPLAQCTMWKRSEGLLHGKTLSTGPKKVTCQRNLDLENHVFKVGQTNTWWVWTTSDDGTWDWYPETALKQGLSDQPVRGIARCENAS